MATAQKPLFRPEALLPKLNGFLLPSRVDAQRPMLKRWAKKLQSGKLDKNKETELLPEFLSEMFGDLLGYKSKVGSETERYTMRREALVEVDGKRADAAFGRFGGKQDHFVAVLEGKGPRDPLDRPFAGRSKSGVDQALNYAVQLKIDWYIVTNMKETRLYYKGVNRSVGPRSDARLRAGAIWHLVAHRRSKLPG